MPRTLAAQQLQLEAALVELPAPSPEKEARSVAHRPPSATASPSAADLLDTPGALLTRSQLRGLGLERRAIDAAFRALPVVSLPGYSRPLIGADHYLAFLEQHTYNDDRVRPAHGRATAVRPR